MISSKYRLNRNIFYHNLFFFFLLFRCVICEGPTDFENNWNPSKFFDKLSQGPALDQPGTKIVINV